MCSLFIRIISYSVHTHDAGEKPTWSGTMLRVCLVSRLYLFTLPPPLFFPPYIRQSTHPLDRLSSWVMYFTLRKNKKKVGSDICTDNERRKTFFQPLYPLPTPFLYRYNPDSIQPPTTTTPTTRLNPFAVSS